MSPRESYCVKSPPLSPASTESSKSDASKDTTRVQLELQPRAMMRLRNLKEDTEASTYAEVVKSALRLYEFVVEQNENGAEFFVRARDGTVMSLPIL